MNTMKDRAVFALVSAMTLTVVDWLYVWFVGGRILETSFNLEDFYQGNVDHGLDPAYFFAYTFVFANAWHMPDQPLVIDVVANTIAVICALATLFTFIMGGNLSLGVTLALFGSALTLVVMLSALCSLCAYIFRARNKKITPSR
jgi:hypothetical protein